MIMKSAEDSIRWNPLDGMVKVCVQGNAQTSADGEYESRAIWIEDEHGDWYRWAEVRYDEEKYWHLAIGCADWSTGRVGPGIWTTTSYMCGEYGCSPPDGFSDRNTHFPYGGIGRCEWVGKAKRTRGNHSGILVPKYARGIWKTQF